MPDHNSQAISEPSSQSEEVPEYPLLLNGEKFFRVKKQEDDGKITAVCLTCENDMNGPEKEVNKCEYRGTRKSNSNFLTHLQRLHPDLYKEYERLAPIKRRRLHYHRFELMCIEEKQASTEKCLLELVVHNFLPPYIINESLEKLIKNLNSEIKMKSSDEIQRQIVKKATEIKDSLIIKLEEISWISFSVTVMIIHGKTLLLVASFWLNKEDLSRQSAFMSCKNYDSDYVTPSIASNAVHDVLTEFGIDNQKVLPVSLNDCVDYYDEFQIFLNHPDEISVYEYVIPKLYDPEICRYQKIELSKDFPSNPKVENSMIHQLMNFAVLDFLPLLKRHDKVNLHYTVFKKLQIIWEYTRFDSQSVEDICKKKVEGPKGCHINDLYKSINSIVRVKDKLNAIMKKIATGNTFNEREITYIEELLEYLRIFRGGILVIESDDKGLYGNAAPVLQTILYKLQELNLTQLDCMKEDLVQEYTETFAQYLECTSCNIAMLAACFHPGYKRDWLPMDVRSSVKHICKEKVSEIAPRIAVRKLTLLDQNRQKHSDFVLMKSQNSFETDRVDIESLTYFDQATDENENFSKLPTIKKLYLQYNTGICNPKNIKSLIEASNIFKIVESKLSTISLVGYYCLINAATKDEEDTS